jgi:hypothetical protein
VRIPAASTKSETEREKDAWREIISFRAINFKRAHYRAGGSLNLFLLEQSNGSECGVADLWSEIRGKISKSLEITQNPKPVYVC